MRASAILLTLLGGQVSAAEPARVVGLIARLGHADFAEREAATTALAGVGESALPALRAALKAEDAEVARRAASLVEGITRAAEARRLLAPTAVTLAATGDAPLTLGDVAASLTKASGVEFVVEPAEFGRTPVTSRAAGPLPLWAAVDRVATELDLDWGPRAIANAPADRIAVALVRGRAGKRWPRFTDHAVAVEASVPAATVKLPADSLSVILQTYAEPKLGFQRLDAVVVTKATDARGQELRTLPAVLCPPPAPPSYRGRGGRNFDPVTVTVLVNPVATNFEPTPAQALVRFANPRNGDEAPERLAALEGFLRATVAGPTEEVARVTGFDKKPIAGVVGRGLSLTVDAVPNAGDGTSSLVVTITTTPGEVGFGDRVKGPSAAGSLAVTDAAGEAFAVSVTTTTLRPMPDGRLQERLFLRLQPTDAVSGSPATLTVTGARPKRLDIPFTLRDVPLHPGTATAPPTPPAARP